MSASPNTPALGAGPPEHRPVQVKLAIAGGLLETSMTPTLLRGSK
jgi:hypothetical protein